LAEEFYAYMYLGVTDVRRSSVVDTRVQYIWYMPLEVNRNYGDPNAPKKADNLDHAAISEGCGLFSGLASLLVVQYNVGS
jgi:hypothetical protein